MIIYVIAYGCFIYQTTLYNDVHASQSTMRIARKGIHILELVRLVYVLWHLACSLEMIILSLVLINRLDKDIYALHTYGVYCLISAV